MKGGREEMGQGKEGRKRGYRESCLPSVSIIATEALGPIKITSLPLTYCIAALNHSVGSRSGFDSMVAM